MFRPTQLMILTASTACVCAIGITVASAGPESPTAADRPPAAGPWYTPAERQALIAYSNASFAEKQAILAGTAHRSATRKPCGR